MTKRRDPCRFLQPLTKEEEQRVRTLLLDERFKARMNACIQEIARRLPECKGDKIAGGFAPGDAGEVRRRSVRFRYGRILQEGRDAMSRPFNICARRVREIALIVLYRHRGLPDSDDADIYLHLIAMHLRPRYGDIAFALGNWARRLGAKLSTEHRRAQDVPNQHGEDLCSHRTTEICARKNLRRSVLRKTPRFRPSVPAFEKLTRQISPLGTSRPSP
jgi:hypothetical protein